MIECPGQPHGNLEIIVTCPGQGIAHLRHHAALPFTTPEAWVDVGRIRFSAFPGPHVGASLILSSYGTLELVAAQSNGMIGHLSYSENAGWQGPSFLPGLAAGAPALIQSRFDGTGSFEV